MYSVIAGKLSFIDLAGSERGADRGEADQKTRCVCVILCRYGTQLSNYYNSKEWKGPKSIRVYWH